MLRVVVKTWGTLKRQSDSSPVASERLSFIGQEFLPVTVLTLKRIRFIAVLFAAADFS
jgi:hypothetical protein